ncbi:MAG: recombinase family protein [Paracoccus sp. (in: a-proteobacteria)]|uniref:recombinase family protein n=1 Tax=Paracoccus sp. TaxID=267 RepID=UPI0026DFEFAD|nr:recombinase family protein [Paracoccus sp. (in: a-proteobacteria)]MDO5622562.1 recombinase family protein [Paracoccus sp. (in: a-proteobacteria)]
MNIQSLHVTLRAALYLRVSTTRQAEHDVSIPDQRKQGEAYCASRGYQLVETFVEAGASATNDRRPEFQRLIEAGTSKPAPFDVVVVHSFSRFFRDHFELEFNVRKLAKNGVKLVSITQEMGDDPMHVMMRQIMALFDEYQSKENGKHVMRALKENARQGFWNGSLPPIGYGRSWGCRQRTSLFNPQQVCFRLKASAGMTICGCSILGLSVRRASFTPSSLWPLVRNRIM